MKESHMEFTQQQKTNSMWSYYGSKKKLVNLYPRPKHDIIIEPFAGAANYALKYFEKDIILLDKSPNIIKIWHYLQECSPSDILRLPVLPAGTVISRNMFQCDSEFLLMRYLIVQGAFSGNNTVSKWGAARFERNRKNVLEGLHKIKHWKISEGSYNILDNIQATWFIDPPYEYGGHKYPESNKKIDFTHLSEYCKNRNGQVIVFENTKATWMDFKPMKPQRGVAFTTVEAIWTNERNDYDNVQQILKL